MATLSLHSLFELRSCIINGTVLLDMRASGVEEIAGTSAKLLLLNFILVFNVICTQRSVRLSPPDMVLDHQELYSPLGPELRKKVRQTLLKQHHHQNQKKLASRLPIVRSIADISRKTSELHLDKHGENRPPPLQLLEVLT